MLLLRLCYLGSIELLPEEAYYWLFSKHLALSYLDHPPMVGWIIWITTGIAGDTEFGVRLGAYILWFVSAFFCFNLTRNLFNKAAAFASIILLSVLPFFTVAGFLMTPDTPLVACWAGALYFLERSLLGRQSLCWIGVGLCMGLGLLSKYTVALLFPATLLFILLDRQSRYWLLRQETFIAFFISILLFLPVIVWNSEHHWISFFFQGERRLLEEFTFNLPNLIGSVLILLTPVGAVSAFREMVSGRTEAKGMEALEMQRNLFIRIFTLTPFLVFLLFSFGREVKLNWTGPLWLAVIPMISWKMISFSPSHDRLDKVIQKSWFPTILCLIFCYILLLSYLAVGAPWIYKIHSNSLDYMVGWKNLALQIDDIGYRVKTATGVEPFVVGMDKNKTASELSFYRYKIKPEAAQSEAINYTVGRHIFGEDSLMFQYWAPDVFDRAKKQGQVLILVSGELPEYDSNYISSWGWTLGNIKELCVKNGCAKSGGKYFYALALHKPEINGSPTLKNLIQ
jgi:dolichol-phosphate mannosyltransferase